MTKAKYMTARWNNLLLLGMGIPILIYTAVALSTSILSEFTGFIIMAIIGAVY
jgi:hypothetical protein